MRTLSRSGLSSAERVSCYLEMNKLKFFVLAILFARQRRKCMG